MRRKSGLGALDDVVVVGRGRRRACTTSRRRACTTTGSSCRQTVVRVEFRTPEILAVDNGDGLTLAAPHVELTHHAATCPAPNPIPRRRRVGSGQRGAGAELVCPHHGVLGCLGCGLCWLGRNHQDDRQRLPKEFVQAVDVDPRLSLQTFLWLCYPLRRPDVNDAIRMQPMVILQVLILLLPLSRRRRHRPPACSWPSWCCSAAARETYLPHTAAVDGWWAQTRSLRTLLIPELWLTLLSREAYSHCGHGYVGCPSSLLHRARLTEHISCCEDDTYASCVIILELR